MFFVFGFRRRAYLLQLIEDVGAILIRDTGYSVLKGGSNGMGGIARSNSTVDGEKVLKEFACAVPPLRPGQFLQSGQLQEVKVSIIIMSMSVEKQCHGRRCRL